MKPIVCISGWDDTDLLRGAVESAAAVGWPVAYCDGAYPLYLDRQHVRWSTDPAELDAVLEPHPGTIRVDAPIAGPWPSEAAKKCALLDAVRANAPDREWALWLDTDERIEAPSGADALASWLDAGLDGLAWATVNLWDTASPSCPEGFAYPRLIRMGPTVTFMPPMDFTLYRDGARIAYMDGETVPVHKRSQFAEVPRELLRIRHDRHLRPVARLEMTGRYAQRRRASVLGGDPRLKRVEMPGQEVAL